MSRFPIYKWSELPEETKLKLLKRSELDVSKIEEAAADIIEDVKAKGDASITEFLSKQVGRTVKPDELRVSEADIAAAYKALDPKVLRAMKHLIRNVTKFHKMQVPKSWEVEIEEGVFAGQRVVPLDAAGVYCPSGKASYPSVSAMVTIPPKVVGVPRIALASPPAGEDMKMDPATLVASHMAGGDEFYIMGGAHAIAAFAYGTKIVKRVDVVAGPGGPWIQSSKRMVRDVVRTDLPAGPSEGMVLADGTVPAKYVAWNTLGEAEHGPDSAGVCVTISDKYAKEVAKEIDAALDVLPEPRLHYVLENIKKYSCVIVCASMEEAVDFVNAYAPEHVTIDSRNARAIYKKYYNRIRHFGTLCLNTPISAGNFGIGPNSTLPTGGFARLYSGLSVDAFLKKPTVEEVRGKGWDRIKDMVIDMAEYEGFPSHAEAFRVRL
jgi:histidinol dehydrogenase